MEVYGIGGKTATEAQRRRQATKRAVAERSKKVTGLGLIFGYLLQGGLIRSIEPSSLDKARALLTTRIKLF